MDFGKISDGIICLPSPFTEVVGAYKPENGRAGCWGLSESQWGFLNCSVQSNDCTTPDNMEMRG